MRRQTHGPAGTRTRTTLSGQRILSPLRDSISTEESTTCGGGGAGARSRPRNAEQNVGDLDVLAVALAAIPETEQAAVVAHVQALAVMTPAKRAALLTLACT